MISGLIVSLFYYNKPHVNVEKSDAIYSLTAQNLIKEYQENELGTDKKYTEQIIEIEGHIHEISTLKGSSVITLKDPESDSSIICHMQAKDNKRALTLKKGQRVTIKGVCTGYLLDVMMVRCILVE
ncbi:hypothetical protein FB2170_04830 [Maribacter sp. HTCC2170]|nr:hypothetical protein FB2170_04830 [Maribacter sp. HTCC2170]